MTATLEMRILSGSTDGAPICIARTATLGTTIHQAVAGTGLTIDRVTAEVCNNDSISHLLTVEIGGAAQANRFNVTIPANVGRFTVLDRHPLRNSLMVTMFADTSSVLTVLGSALRGIP